MEIIAAVYAAENKKTGKVQYGHTWAKPFLVRDKELLLKQLREKQLEKDEKLVGAWTIEWRNPSAKYNAISGMRASPKVDVAAALRAVFLKSRGKKDSGWKNTTMSKPAAVYLPAPVKSRTAWRDRGIEPMGPVEGVPYSIEYPPDRKSA